MLPRFSQFKSVLALFTFLALTFFTIPPAHAGRDEMALFFDELVPYGDWVDYKQYGAVWYPTKEVAEGWRPYLDGRWVPTAKGWVFETKEPWAWATYHFGNWMATQEYGWVWVPGSTWYASTATWRKSKQAIGWAPVPPPNYEPEPAFVPAGGFPADTPVQEQLIPAMYVYAEGPAFLQGTDQPYTQEYSYMNSGGLVPPQQLPEMFSTTEMVNNFVSEGLNPEAVANWGPPLDTVSEYTGVSPMALMNTTNATDVTMVQNGWPPPMVLSRRAYFVTLLPTSAYVVRPILISDRRMLSHLYGPGEWKRGHGNFPLPPHGWPPKRTGAMGPHPKFGPEAFGPGKHPGFLGLPIKATSFGGIKRPGGPFAAPGGKPFTEPPGGRGNLGLKTAPAGSKGPIPVATDRRAQLAQERDRMEKEKSLIHKGQTEGGISPIKQHGKSMDTAGSSAKTTRPVKPGNMPDDHRPLKNPSGSQVSSTPKTTGTSRIGQPGAAGQPPPTAEQLGKQREAQKQEQIKQLQQKQQASGIAPGGQPAPSSGPGGGPRGGMMGSASPQAPGGSIRSPKTAGGPTGGGPGSPAPGGFGIRSPKQGGGTGSGSMAGQPAMGGRQGGPAQTPKVQTQQVHPPTPPKGGGGGGGKPPPSPKKQEKKP